MKKLIIVSILLGFSFIGVHSQSCFTPIWTGNGYDHMNLYITRATLDGVNLKPGDEVGVFDGDDCVGVSVLTAELTGLNYLLIIASGNDPVTGEKDGFASGNPISFRLCVNGGADIITNIQVTYSSGSGFFTPGGTVVAQLDGIKECANPPSLTLGSMSGSTCGLAPVTVTGNLFGGSATSVAIITNGTGSIVPSSTSSSPFDFTYTPGVGDIGNTVTITVTTDNPLGSPCAAATATYTLTVTAIPPTPVVAVVDNCDGTSTLSTTAEGSLIWSTDETTATIIVTDAGTYSVTTTVDGCTSLAGSGTAAPKTTPSAPIVTVVDNCNGTSTLSTTAPGTLLWSTGETTATIIVNTAGQYSVTTTVDGCTSDSGSGTAAPKTTPPAPVSSVDCSLGFNFAVVTVTSPTGGGYEYRLNDGAYQSSTVFENVVNGSYTITVRNADGCETTGSSFEVSCGCVDGPTLTLGSTSGSTCGTTPIAVIGNTFGGSATSVAIITNGTGSIVPSSTSSSPFDFTYTPGVGDIGNTVTITVTTDNPLGSPCAAATATYTLTVTAIPQTPVVTVVDNCNGTSTLSTTAPGTLLWSTGETTATIIVNIAGTYSVTTTVGECSSMPGSGTAAPKTTPAAPIVTIVDNCNGTSTLSTTAPGTLLWSTGETTATIIVNIAGTYSVTTTVGECTSMPGSGTAAPKTTPSAPILGDITQPTCSATTGSVELNGLPETGTWTLTRTPGGITSTGTGTSTTVSGLASGTYTFTVINAEGCISPASGNVVIDSPPAIPPAPVIALNCSLGFNNAIVSVTSPVIDGDEFRLNDGPYQTSTVFPNVVNGSYTVTVRNAEGCETTSESFEVSCGCVNGPTLTLGSTSGSTCGTTPITVSGNQFGGNATSVTITTNGTGTVNPTSTSSSSFSFTYTPGAADAGNTITITVTTNNPLGEPCVSATATYSLSVNIRPVIVSTSSASRCGTGTVILGATATEGIINWYAELTGGTPIGTGTSFTTPVINSTTTYYVDATENECTSDRTPVLATVIQIPEPAGPITGPATFTPGTSGVAYSVSAIASATSYIWSYTGTGVTINGEDNNITLDFTSEATPGQLRVLGRNDCGDGVESSIELTPSTKTLTLNSVLLQGLYTGSGLMNQAYNEFGPQWPAGVADQITIQLHEGTNYSTIVWSQTGVALSTSGTAVLSVPGEYSGTYYITIRHRNSLETTTAVPVSFAGSTIEQSFGSRADVYGGNLGTTPDGRFVIYAGDVNQDGFIDTQDYIDVDNDSYNYASGYLVSDVDGNGMVDTNDYIFIDNNNYNYIGAILPPPGIAINLLKSIQTDKKTVNDQNITTEYEKGF